MISIFENSFMFRSAYYRSTNVKSDTLRSCRKIRVPLYGINKESPSKNKETMKSYGEEDCNLNFTYIVINERNL